MKLSSIVINKMIEMNCSRLEINLIIFLSQLSLDNGLIPNVYYKDVISFLRCNTTTFYRLLYKLQCKGIIQYDISEKYGFYNITILDNDYSNKDYSVKYVNTNKCVFNKAFFDLKATEKYVFLKLLISDNGKKNEIKLSSDSVAKYANVNCKNKKIIERIINNIKEFKYNNNTIFEVFEQVRRKGVIYFFRLIYLDVIHESGIAYIQNCMFRRFMYKHKVKYNDGDILDLIQMDNEYKAYNALYKNVVKEVVLYYGSVECRVIRHKMKAIVDRVSKYNLGNDKFEAII